MRKQKTKTLEILFRQEITKSIEKFSTHSFIRNHKKFARIAKQRVIRFKNVNELTNQLDLEWRLQTIDDLFNKHFMLLLIKGENNDHIPRKSG